MGNTILVVGSINIDLVIHTPHMPLPGQNVPGSDFRIIPGGKGSNQAVGAARLGCPTLMAGRVGADTFANTLLVSLGAAGVDTTHVERDPDAATGVALIMVDRNGENSIVFAPGANGRFSVASVERLEPVIAEADVVLAQLELPYTSVGRALEMARALGKVAILDAGPPCAEPRPAFFDVTVLTPNEAEAAALIGRPITGRASALGAARELLAKGPQAVVLKLGAQGALLATREQELFLPAYKVPVVDTTAAGDAFSAALAVALAHGEGLERAGQVANAAGALAVQKAGAQPSLPTQAELGAFLADHRMSGLGDWGKAR